MLWREARLIYRRLADCWVANIGPAPKRYWYEGHEELEQALARLARFTDRLEGPGNAASSPESWLRRDRFVQHLAMGLILLSAVSIDGLRRGAEKRGDIAL